MKIVFSRKGFDGSAGGYPSPIIDGMPVSLPIPYLNSTRSYYQQDLDKIVTDLTNGKVRGSDFCHNDPDLRIGAFGQVSSAQSHLENQKVGPGDLFLFFGWFRDVEIDDGKYRYRKDARDHHRIFGWMFIDQKMSVGANTDEFRRKFHKYAAHPHAIGEWGHNNTIYLAPDTVFLFEKISIRGFGILPKSEQTLLSNFDAPSKRYWNVPDWLNPEKGGCIPSYHDEKNYIDGFLKTAGRGQEFVCQPKHETDEFKEWLLDLFSKVVAQ